MSITPITNHVDLAIARLVEQYKGKQNLIGLITALVGPLQEIEDSLIDLSNLRALATSEGILLDRLGTIVGILREPGQSDTDYRISITAKIVENISRGEPEKVIQVYRLITGASLVLIDEMFPAAVNLSSEVFISQAQANILFGRIKKAIAAGVRLEGLISFAAGGDSFAFDGSTAAKGFGSTTDLAAGGKFATVTLDTSKKFSMDGTNPNSGGFGSILDPLVGGVFVGL